VNKDDSDVVEDDLEQAMVSGNNQPAWIKTTSAKVVPQ